LCRILGSQGKVKMMTNKGIFGVFCSGSLTMMLLMCACMVATATVAPAANPLTIISAAIFGPVIITVLTSFMAYKVAEANPNMLRLTAE
jgi:uncharacterized membrane protein YdjX (TVP38/TMEM64 family)